MKKAEQIFKDTKYECRKHIETWGYSEGVGFNKLNTEELVYKRTANEIQKLIDRAKKDISIDYTLGIFTEAEAKKEAQIISMVQNTLNNQHIA